MKDYIKYGLIALIILLLGISIGVVLYKNISNDDKKNEGSNITLKEISKSFKKTDYCKDKSCKIDIDDKLMRIKCKGGEYNFRLNNDYLEIDTNKNGLDVVKNVVNVVEKLLGSDKDYLSVMDTFFTGKIFLNNIITSRSNELYSFRISLEYVIDYYEVNDVYKDTDMIDVTKRDYEINVGNYVISDIDFASDKDLNIYVMAGTIFNEAKEYSKSVKVTFYDKNDNVLNESIVFMDDFDKTNTFLRFSVVVNDFDKIEDVSKFMINIE